MNLDLRLSGGKKLKSPPGRETRPTTSRVREALMNILREKLNGSNWLDLFSGSGVMGCEALQNGALKVLAIEKNKKTAQICRDNLLSTADYLSEVKYVGVIQSEVNAFLRKTSRNIKIEGFDENTIFNFVYLDPPYKNEKIYAEILKSLVIGKWLKKDSIVICEHSAKIPINPESKWIEIDRRIYGSTSLLLISHPD